MDVNSLGNATFSNRNFGDSESNRTDETEGTTRSVKSFRNTAENSASILTISPALARETVQENNNVQTNKAAENQTGEQKSGSQVDLMV